MESARLKEGTVISCPDCKKPMVKCIKIPKSMQSNWDSCFEFIEFKGGRGAVAICDCGSKKPFYHQALGVWVEPHGYIW